MNEKLTKWSMIAEIVGGVGVFITLIVLIFEVRANTELTRTLAFQQEIGNLNEWRRSIARDPNQARIFTSYNRGEKLPERGSEDDLILQFIVVDQISNYESGYYSHVSGNLGDSEWSRVLVNACESYRSAQRHEGFWDRISRRFTLAFSEYIEANC